MNNSTFTSVMNTEIGGFTLGHIVKALLALIVCIITVKVITGILKKAFSKTKMTSRASDIIVRVIRAVMFIITAVVVASSLGMNTSSLVAMVSVVSLGLTIAAEDVLGNVAGGYVAQAGHIFEVGDFIRIGETEGNIISISLNHTRIKTLDGTTVVIPNKLISTQFVTNYTQNGTRRVGLYLDIEYGTPAEKVRASGLRAIRSIGFALDNPEAKVRIWQFKESSVNYYLSFWVPAERYYEAIYAVNEALQNCFAEDGVKFTYNHLNIHIKEDSVKLPDRSDS